MDQPPTRKIIHVDMDAFYASVEQRDRPELKGKPVVVGGNPNGRGVVASASYEARRFGIRSAMPARQALKLCPKTVFVRPDFTKYKTVSRQIRAIFLDATDLVEPLSLDEAYLDVTTNKLGLTFASEIAVLIRRRIQTELGLTASAGVAPNKFLAKLASDLKKPNGLVVIPPEKVEEFVRQLPVGRLWGVGPATERKLETMGILTTEDLRRVGSLFLQSRLGKFGGFLHRLAHGEDNRAVNLDRDPKSRGSETTFESDVLDLAVLRATLKELAEDVARSLDRMQLKARNVTLKVRYEDFTTVTRSRTLALPFHEAAAIDQIAGELLGKTEAGSRPVRLLGISTSHFSEPETDDPAQLSLLDL